MPTRTVTVEISKPDPFGLQEQCEQWCRDHLAEVADLDPDEAAETLLRGYLQTIDPRTTGADALGVFVREFPEE